MSKVEAMSVFHYNVVQCTVVNAGRKDPSFLPTKKKPTPAGEENGRIIPLCQGVLDVVGHGLHLWPGQGKQMTLRNRGAWHEVDGTIIFE